MTGRLIAVQNQALFFFSESGRVLSGRKVEGGGPVRNFVHGPWIKHRWLRRSGAMRKFGVGGGCQAAGSSAACPGSPSRKWTPWMSWPKRSDPSNRRPCRSADLASSKIIASAVRRDGQPLLASVRSRTVAEVLSMGLLARRCCQCSAGKSWRASRASRSLVRQAAALSDSTTKRSNATSGCWWFSAS